MILGDNQHSLSPPLKEDLVYYTTKSSQESDRQAISKVCPGSSFFPEMTLAGQCSNAGYVFKLAPFLLSSRHHTQVQQCPKEEEEKDYVSTLCLLFKREQDFLRNCQQTSRQASLGQSTSEPCASYND